MKNKFYVVWAGRTTGIFDSWDDCRLSVMNYPGARYKAFSSSAEAARAYRRESAEEDAGQLGALLAQSSDRSAAAAQPQKRWESHGDRLADLSRFPEIDLTAWAVDASCLGNPGVMEYQGVEVATGRVIFRVGPFQKATNNIGEYLAIVHALALMEKTGERHTIYSDSKIAQGWVRRGRCNTKITPTPQNAPVRELIMRADHWLATHPVNTPVIKWDTVRWGEIPADFGRK